MTKWIEYKKDIISFLPTEKNKYKKQYIITLFNFLYSKYNDYDEEQKNLLETPIEIDETFKNYLGVSLSLYFKRNDNGLDYNYLLKREFKDGYIDFIEINDLNKIGEYIEYLTYLGIYEKIARKKGIINHDYPFEKKEIDIENPNDFRKVDTIEIKVVNDNFFENSDFSNKIIKLKNILSNYINKQSLNNFNNIQQKYDLSFYEIRKLINLKYENIKIDSETLNSLNLYKHGLFNKINKFLYNDREFILSNINSIINENIIEHIIKIYKFMQNIKTNEDIYLYRLDTRFKNVDTIIKNESFISTTLLEKFMSYAHEGINSSDLAIIHIPKGTNFFPMDLINERLMNTEKDDEYTYANDLGYEEGEILLPMGNLKLLKYDENNIPVIEFSSSINVFSILLNRLKEYKKEFVQVIGKDKFADILKEIAKESGISYEEISYSENENLEFSESIKGI